MKWVHGFMNIYRSGHYHRQGKPLAFDRHGGDVYPTYAAAVADIDPPELCVATVPVKWLEDEEVKANGPDSHPVPLRKTRVPHGSYGGTD